MPTTSVASRRASGGGWRGGCGSSDDAYTPLDQCDSAGIRQRFERHNKAAATLYGSGTLDYREALGLATVAQLAGSVASVFLAGALLTAFSGKGLVPIEVVGNPAFLVSVGAGSAATVLIATRAGIPVSTTHAMIGGLVGSALWFAPTELVWHRLGAKYFGPLLLSPVLALLGASLLYPLARGARQQLGLSDNTCVCVDGLHAPVTVMGDGTMAFAPVGMSLRVDALATCTKTDTVVAVPTSRALDVLHIGSGLSLGFARGLNDTPKVLALVVAAGWSGLDPRLSLGVIAVAMAIGGALHARRVAETLGNKIDGELMGRHERLSSTQPAQHGPPEAAHDRPRPDHRRRVSRQAKPRPPILGIA
jgi:inorganic phosphate transporter, PiT family